MEHVKEAVTHYVFILKKGTPVCARNLNEWISSVALVLIIGHFGTSCCAANQATDMISCAMYMFVQASRTTIGILFSKWIGSHFSLKNEEVWEQIKKMLALALIPAIIVLCVVLFLKTHILNAFSLQTKSYARELAEIILIIHFVTFPLYVIQHIANSFLDALFDTKIPSLFTFFVSYAFVLPFAFIAVNFLDLPPYFVWIIDGVGMALIALFVIIRLFRITRIQAYAGETNSFISLKT